MPRYRATSIRQVEIQDAALEVIDLLGLPGLTMKAVATRLGLVPSALYRHYRNKEALLEAMVRRLDGQLGENLARAEAAPSVLEGLEGLVARQAEMLERRPGMVRLVFGGYAFSAESARREQIRGLWARFREGLARLVERGRGRGELRADLDATAAALSIMAMFQATALLRHLEGPGRDVGATLAGTWRILRRGLLPVAGEGGGA